MRRILLGFSFLSVILAAPIVGLGQTDEVSEATGLPIPIGQPVIYGQVSIENRPRDARRPNVFVALLISGTQIDRRQANDRGYFYFLERPRHGHTLVFEVDGMEVGRAYLTIGNSNRLRHDVSVDWRALQGAAIQKTGSVSVNQPYERNEENQKTFDRAMQSIRDKNNSAAIDTLTELTAKDPKDFVAWTLLGTALYADKKISDATAAFLKAIELKPDYVLALLNLAKLELERKNLDKAIEYAGKAVAADPKSADANHVLGEAYLQNKKGSLAVGYLNTAIELAPVEKADIHLRLAALYDGAGLKDRAAAEYKAYLEKVKDPPNKKKLEEYVKANGSK